MTTSNTILDTMIHNSTLKAAMVTVLFAAFGIVGGMIEGSQRAVPSHVALFILLLVHTFFSVRCFSALIDPKDKRQMASDAALVACYFMLGLTIKASEFLVWWIVLFIFASVKYALLVGRFQHPVLLRRKLVADILGVSYGLAFLNPEPVVGMKNAWDVFRYHYLLHISIYDWLWVGAFALATIYYFFVRPLYVPDKEPAV